MFLMICLTSGIQLAIAAAVTIGITLAKRNDRKHSQAVLNQLDNEMLSLVAQYGEGIKTTEAFKVYASTIR